MADWREWLGSLGYVQVDGRSDDLVLVSEKELRMLVKGVELLGEAVEANRQVGATKAIYDAATVVSGTDEELDEARTAYLTALGFAKHRNGVALEWLRGVGK